MAGQSFVSPATRARIRSLAVPIALALGRLGLTPNALTIIGFVGTCVAAFAAAGRAWVVAGLLVLVFGIFDLFDGALARATGTVSAFGGFLDSTLDRLGENLVYAGIVIGSAVAGFEPGVLLGALAMATASVVTYTRARAEALGLHGEVGIAPRPERLVVLAIGLVATGVAGSVGPWTAACPTGLSDSCLGPDMFKGGDSILSLALGIIVLTSSITVVQRIVHVHRQAPKPGAAPQPEED